MSGSPAVVKDGNSTVSDAGPIATDSDQSSVVEAIKSASNSTSSSASIPNVQASGPAPNVSLPNPLNATDQIGQQFKKAIKGFLSDSAEGGTDHAANWSTALKDPIIGTPAPRGPPNPAVGGSKIDLAFTTAVNPPWAGFVGDIYWGLSCGLALGLLFIVVAFLGVRYKSIDPMVRKKLTRRVFFAFMAIFFWLPTASLAGQFFNELGFAIVNSAPPGKTAVVFLAGVFQISNTIGFEGLILIFILSMYVWIKSVLIFLGRWIGLILLTLFMPVVGVFWALEVWPLNRFSGLAKQIAGAYPGLLVAGIPPAILIRLALEGNTWGLPPKFMVYVNLLILFLAAKSQRIMVEKTSSYATKGADMFSGTAKTGLVLGATAVGGTATGSMVSAGMKAKEGKAASMEAYQLHRSLSSKQPPQAESSTDDDSESAETPSSSGSSADAASNDDDSESGQPDSSAETTPSPDDSNKDSKGLASLFKHGNETSSSDENGSSSDGGPESGNSSQSDNGSATTGWYSSTNHGEVLDGEATGDASQDGYSQGDRVVIGTEDFDHTEKRGVVTDAAAGELKVRPEAREVSEDMTLDASDVAMYERGQEVDRTYNTGDSVRITSDDFAGDTRATVTKPPVPGKDATVRPVNAPGEVEVSPENLAAASTDSSTAESIDDGDVEPLVPPGWGDGGRPTLDSSIELEPLNPIGPSPDMEPTPLVTSDSTSGSPPGSSGGETTSSSPPESPSGPESSSESGSDIESDDSPRPGDEVPGTDGVETPGRTAREVTGSSDSPRPGDEVPDTEGVQTPGRSTTEITDSSLGDQPPQGGDSDFTNSTTELDPSDIVENPDAEKYQQGFDDGSPDTSQPPTSQTTAQPDSNSAPQSTSSTSLGASDGRSQQSDSVATDAEESTVGSDSGQSIKDALATDDDVLGPEAYAEPFETENTESDD